MRLGAARSKARDSIGNKTETRAIASGECVPIDVQVDESCHSPVVVFNTSDLHQSPDVADIRFQEPCVLEEVVGSSSAGLEDTNSAEENSEAVPDPVVLDVGFAQVQLKKSQAWPQYEFYIVANDGFLTTDGAVALLDYLDFVLHLPDVMSTGFVLTYDMQNCLCPQLDLVSWIMHYISSPEREEEWHERCVCWKVVVSPGIYFDMAQSVLALLFKVCPPKCRVFLLTDLDASKAESWICYKPEDLQQPSQSILSTISSGFLETFFPAYPRPIPASERAFISGSTLPSAPTEQETPPSDDMEEVFYEAIEVAEDEIAVFPKEALRSTAAAPELCACAESLTTDFATISQGFDKSSGTGYLKIVGHDAPMSDASLSQIMDFMDNFVDSKNAQKGYAITYDLRRLSVPSMKMVMCVAEWGNQPERQAKWTKLNTACKVVINPGFRFTMAKGVLKSFFYICPPVCRTFLLTDPDEPENTALVFHPPAQASLKEEEDSQTDEIRSDDGGSSCGNSADASDTTSASACISATEEEEEPKAMPAYIAAASVLSKQEQVNLKSKSVSQQQDPLSYESLCVDGHTWSLGLDSVHHVY